VIIAEGRDPLTRKRRRSYSTRRATAEAQQKTWNVEEHEADGVEPLRPALDPDVLVRDYVRAYLAARDRWPCPKHERLRRHMQRFGGAEHRDHLRPQREAKVGQIANVAAWSP
jgi:hypothetical protein